MATIHDIRSHPLFSKSIPADLDRDLGKAITAFRASLDDESITNDFDRALAVAERIGDRVTPRVLAGAVALVNLVGR